MKKSQLKKLIKESIKELINEQTDSTHKGMASGNGILDTNTNTVIPYTQEIVDALNDQGIDTSNIVIYGTPKADDTQPELPTPNIDNKDQEDLDTSDRLQELAGIKPLYTLNEQPLTSGWRIHSCLCGLQGTVITNGPLAGFLWCPSNPPSGGVVSTFFFWCNNCSVNGQQPNDGDQFYWDDFGTLTGNPYQNHQVANNGVTTNINGAYCDYSSCSCGGTCPSNCASVPVPPCDPNAWPNFKPWYNNWTNNNAFQNVNNNPNQPCNHICGQIQNWTNNLSGAGPVQTNQLACKIDQGNIQAQIHGCNC
jgi:hypothetical protein